MKSNYSEAKRGNADRKEVLDASTLLIGFTGSLGSGCTFLAEGIRKMLGDTCHYYRLSDILRNEAKKKGIKKVTTLKLQDLGNELRANNVSILAEKTHDRVKTDAAIKPDMYTSDKSVILLDGIKNEGEIRYFRQYPNFYLISVHASRETRKKRLVGNRAEHRFSTEKAFEEADKRDESEDIPGGQQVKLCNYLSDIIIDNDTDIPSEAKAERDKYLSEIVHDYVCPIQAVQNRERLPFDRPPSLDETLMTMAYCMSKKSSCLKRKVGAVIAYVREFEKLDGNDPRKDSNVKFQVVSVGYNDVPLGSAPCVFTEYRKCYRDYLQDIRLKKFRCCPNCGKGIPKKVLCPYCKKKSNPITADKCFGCNATIPPYKCDNCGTNVFDMLVLKDNENTSKLLDMCRSLHAEENGIIGLAGITKTGPGKLVLYTTTYPCNLCANKIVAADIKEVVYAEPYTIKEAEKILDAGRVNVRKFKGIKSTAYFRLYS